MTISIHRQVWFPILLLAVAVGCGADEEPAAAPASKPAAQSGGSQAAAPNEVVWGNELPAGFPSDVPRYPNSSVTRARAGDDQGLVVSFESDDDMAVVAKYYEDQFASDGWSTRVENAPEGKVIFADKGNRTAAATITIGADKTKVDFILFQVN